MRDLWKLIEMGHGRNQIIRFSIFPSGRINLGIYNHDESQQYLYEAMTFDEIEKEVMKDFRYCVPKGEVKPSMPLPSGFPRP